MGEIGSLANDYDNGNLSIDSFGRAFQQNTVPTIPKYIVKFSVTLTGDRHPTRLSNHSSDQNQTELRPKTQSSQWEDCSLVQQGQS
jgi:hypothetical protein